MARKCSLQMHFGEGLSGVTTQTNQSQTPLAHLQCRPQYADWSTVHLGKDVQTLEMLNGIADLAVTTPLEHLQNTMLQKSQTEEYMILTYT